MDEWVNGWIAGIEGCKEGTRRPSHSSEDVMGRWLG